MKEIPNRPSFIWQMENILQFVKETQDFFSQEIDTDNGDEIAYRIAWCISSLSASTNAVASAKWYAQAAYRMEYENIAKEMVERAKNKGVRDLVPPSILKDYITSRTAEFIAVQAMTERINATITHSMEGLRSILSKLKEDKKASTYAGQL